MTDPTTLDTTVTALRVHEFRELRATIRERGTARAIVSVITFVSWAVILGIGLGIALANAPGRDTAFCALAPLLVLYAGFEVTLALHVGAERIGRYLFVYYESEAAMPKWETAMAAFGQTPAAAAPRLAPLGNVAFTLAALTNLALCLEAVAPWSQTSPAGAHGWPVATLALAGHALFVARIYQAVRQVRGQRDRDTAAFLEIARSRSPAP